jgi:hypothetical protein
LAQRRQKITPLAVFQHGVVQVARRDAPLGQQRHFALLLLNYFIEYIQGFNSINDSTLCRF